MNIFEEVKKLNFSIGKYVVVGSGTMAAHNIRQAKDIDIVVVEELFSKCANNGWKEKMRPNGKKGLKRGNIEVYLDVNYGNYNPKTQDLIRNAEIINGIPFLRLEDLIKFKKEYNREKDIQDIQLIERHLKTKSDI